MDKEHLKRLSHPQEEITQGQKKLRIYLDSNIFIAFIKSEIGKPLKLMFHETEQFLSECVERYTLVLSDHVLEEIERAVHYSGDATIELLKEMEINVFTAFKRCNTNNQHWSILSLYLKEARIIWITLYYA